MAGNQLMDSLGVAQGNRERRPHVHESEAAGPKVEPAVISREVAEKNSPERLGELRRQEEEGLARRTQFYKDAAQPGFTGEAPTSAQVTAFNACVEKKIKQEKYTAQYKDSGLSPITLRDVMTRGAVLVEGYSGELVKLVNAELRGLNPSYRPKDTSTFDSNVTAELKKFEGKLGREATGIVDNKLFRELHNANLRKNGKPIDTTAVQLCSEDLVPNAAVSPTSLPTASPIIIATPVPEATINAPAPAAAVNPLLQNVMRGQPEK